MATRKKNESRHLFCIVQIGMGGAYHSWSPMFPDAGGLLLSLRDLKLDGEVPPTTIVTDREDKQKKTPCRIILFEKGRQAVSSHCVLFSMLIRYRGKFLWGKIPMLSSEEV